MTEKEILEMIKWFATKPKEIQREIWIQLGAQNQTQAEEKRKEFAKAIKEVKSKLTRDKRKYLDREVGLVELKETTRLRIATIRKPRKTSKTRKGKLAKKVKLRMELIEQLRAEGLGWRLIARYLAKHAGLQISHVHLYRLYCQIKEDQQNDQTEKIIQTQDQKIVIRKKSG